MSLLFYKRPNYVAKNTGPMEASDYQQYLEKTRRSIPTELCFEYVVSNRAMPPCSLYDFMGYLLYVSHDAENLQFFLWLQDYKRRFAAAPRSEQALSPEWDEDALPPPIINTAANLHPWISDRTLAQTMDYKISFDPHDTISLSPMASALNNKASFMSGSNQRSDRSKPFHVQQTTGGSDTKWQPFTIQPFRAEIDRIISHYLSPGALRELNISYKDRSACLHALQHTTHPSAFIIPGTIVTENLRNHSHPNFIRWSTVNGNTPRIIFGRVLGATNILIGFLVAILLTISYKARWWRFFSIFPLILGFMFLLAGSNGICLVLYATKDRHLRPWEQFTTDAAPLVSAKGYGDDEADQHTLATSDIHSMSTSGGMGKRKGHFALEAFGTANSYGHEVWVEKYRAKMIIRKIFDKSIWVQNEHVRLMQDKVALQSVIWSIIATIPLTVLFVALPRGHAFDQGERGR